MGRITVKSLGGRTNALTLSFAMSKTGGRMPRPDGSAGLHMAVYGVMVASFLIMMLVSGSLLGTHSLESVFKQVTSTNHHSAVAAD